MWNGPAENSHSQGDDEHSGHDGRPHLQREHEHTEAEFQDAFHEETAEVDVHGRNELKTCDQGLKHHVMAVDRQEDQHPQQAHELPQNRNLPTGDRIESADKIDAHLDANEFPRDDERVHHEADGEAQHHPDHEFGEQQRHDLWP